MTCAGRSRWRSLALPASARTCRTWSGGNVLAITPRLMWSLTRTPAGKPAGARAIAANPARDSRQRTPSSPLIERYWGYAPSLGLRPERVAIARRAPGAPLLRRRLDVVLIVDRERPHQDAQAGLARRVLGDRVVAQPPGVEALAGLGLDGAGREAVGRVVGQVAEVDEAPEGELGRAAVLGVGQHLGRHAEAADLDLVAQALVLHRLGGGHDADRGRGHDELHVRVLVDQRQRLVVARLGLVVAVDDPEQLEL